MKNIAVILFLSMKLMAFENEVSKFSESNEKYGYDRSFSTSKKQNSSTGALTEDVKNKVHSILNNNISPNTSNDTKRRLNNVLNQKTTSQKSVYAQSNNNIFDEKINNTKENTKNRVHEILNAKVNDNKPSTISQSHEQKYTNHKSTGKKSYRKVLRVKK